ncbi:MAG: hypothetical protein P4L26_02775 [Terracidiphilus sp.]|nr:hypothetical protein [Terracidiphilus sp.]
MANVIDAGELEAQYFEILKRVGLGESFMIAVEGRPVAELRPATAESLEVLEQLCSSRFKGATDDAVREFLGEEQRQA